MEPLHPQQTPSPQNRPSAEDEQEPPPGSASYQAHSVSVTESARQVPDTSAARLNRGIKSYLLYIQGSPESLLGRLLLWSGAATDEAFIKAVIHGESHRLPELVDGLSDKKAVFREAIDYAIRFCHPELIIELPGLLLEEYDDEMQSFCAQQILHSYYKSIHATLAEHQFQQCCTEVFRQNTVDIDVPVCEVHLNLLAALVPVGLKPDIWQEICAQLNINFDQLLARSAKLYLSPASSVFPEQTTVIEALAGETGFSPELIRMSYSAQPEEISEWINSQPDSVDAFKKALECCILTDRPGTIQSLLGAFTDKSGFSVPSSCLDSIRKYHWDKSLSPAGKTLCSCFIPYLDAERRHAFARSLETDVGMMVTNAICFLNEQEAFPELATLSQKLLEVVLDEKDALPRFYNYLFSDEDLMVALIHLCVRAKNLDALVLIIENKLWVHPCKSYSDEQKLLLMTVAREMLLRGQFIDFLSIAFSGPYSIKEDIIANAEENDLYRLVAIRLGYYRDEGGIVSLYQKNLSAKNYSDCALLIPFLPDRVRESEAIKLLAEAPPGTLIQQACLIYQPFPGLEREISKFRKQLQEHHADLQGAEAARYCGNCFSHYLDELHEHDPARVQKETDSLFRLLIEKKQYGVMDVCVSELNRIGHRINLSDPELQAELVSLKGIKYLVNHWDYYVDSHLNGVAYAHHLLEKMWQEDAAGLLVCLQFVQSDNTRRGHNSCVGFVRSVLTDSQNKERLLKKLPVNNIRLINQLIQGFLDHEPPGIEVRKSLAGTPSAMITWANETDFGNCMIRALLYADACLSESLTHPPQAGSGIKALMKRKLVACCRPFVRHMRWLMATAPGSPETARLRWLPDEPDILKSMPDDRKNRAFQALFDALEQIKKDDRSEDVARRCDLIAGYLENLRVRLTKIELGGLALRQMLQEDISGVATEQVPGLARVRLDRLKTWHCSALRQTALEQLGSPTKPDI